MIKRANTAITRNTLSVPMRILANRLHGAVLDYGCGRGYDVLTLNANGLNIVGFDKFHDASNKPELLNAHYDVVTCNYVFNVIEDITERQEVMNLLCELADVVYVAVRADKKSVKPEWTPYADGYISTTNTFQKFYDDGTFRAEFAGYEIIETLINNSSSLMYSIRKA